jgi:hypothetical protein
MNWSRESAAVAVAAQMRGKQAAMTDKRNFIGFSGEDSMGHSAYHDCC